MTPLRHRAEITVDLAAVRHNVRLLADTARRGGALLMSVVKADAYGHGMVEVAVAAREAGADWLGVATPEEALALRAAGDTGPLLCWLTAPGDDFRECVAAGVDVSAYTTAHLDAIAAAGRGRVHLKVDTGLSRGGAPREAWDEFFAHAAALQESGAIEVVGLWSHLVSSDDPADPVNDLQEKVFVEADQVAREHGLDIELRHIANSAATLSRPSMHFDMVRCGVATYGLQPAPGAIPDPGLVPAMTVRAKLAMTKHIDAGVGVSYGHMWTSTEPTTLGLVPAGYADGIPRSASNAAEVFIRGRRRPMRGKVCMDQFVVDLFGEELVAGEEVVLFSTGEHGEPTAQDWAEAAGTINYEIVTRIGGRFTRVHVDSERDGAATE